jgi:hypothetical protein
MRKNFHESFGHSAAVKPPSERSTGLVFACVALVVAVLWRHTPNVLWTASGAAVVLAAFSLVAPKLLKPLNLLWFRFGLLLHRVVNPLVMLAMFVVVFLPGGMIMRLWHDPLRSRRARGPGATYWIERRSGTQGAGSMTNQF